MDETLGDKQPQERVIPDDLAPLGLTEEEFASYGKVEDYEAAGTGMGELTRYCRGALNRLVWRIIIVPAVAAVLSYIVHAGLCKFYGHHPDDAESFRFGICQIAGNELLGYAKKHGGVFPPAGWDAASSQPMWLSVLRKEDSSALQMLSVNSSQVPRATDFEYNAQVAGRKLSEFPESARPQIPLISLRYKGNSRIVYYLNRSMAVSKTGPSGPGVH